MRLPFILLSTLVCFLKRGPEVDLYFLLETQGLDIASLVM